MKFAPLTLSALIAALVCALPVARLESQQALPADPGAALQSLQTVNDNLLKRQEATLKDLTDLTTQAREIRIYSRRG